MRAAVSLAVSEANARGGLHGLAYEVFFRPDDGPWGMGAKQVAALAYEDSVWVILGGLNGGDAHLAELIAAKVWVPVVTPTASDLTIDYANVPWVFRCFPSDADQARLLLQHARARGHQRLLVLSEADREGRTGRRRLQDAAESWPGAVIDYREYTRQVPEASAKPNVLQAADAVLIWGGAESGALLLRSLRRAGFEGAIMGPAHLLTADLLADNEMLGEVVIASPYDLSRDDEEIQRFRRAFERATGRPADPVALFAYDATCLVIAAIEQAGLNRALIRDVLAERGHDGIAGTYRFDGLGGSSLEPVLVTSHSGEWLPVD
jgi:branched-chain amino acid transport system substrate-binding protein